MLVLMRARAKIKFKNALDFMKFLFDNICRFRVKANKEGDPLFLINMNDIVKHNFKHP